MYLAERLQQQSNTDINLRHKDHELPVWIKGWQLLREAAAAILLVYLYLSLAGVTQGEYKVHP